MDAGEILIIEDEQDARELLGEILRFRGFQVTEATNGAEAWKYLQGSGRPGLIILDLMMPSMDGREFRALQLGDPGLASIPVVVMSAVDPSAPADLGAAAVIQKPLDVLALLELVRSNCLATRA
jgi:CheY-like chemotaxis protein